tara:strand:- start:1091 stop:1582 length:492 start_codon:yes stop_codon:yes gene_type:complete
LVNDSIHFKSVVVIGEDGTNLGVLSTKEALGVAKEQGLDLVVVAPNSDPPVCKITDYDKRRFSMKRKKSQKKQVRVQLKEIKMRPVIDKGDYNIKCAKIRSFIEAGHRVKIVVRFRGREVVHQEIGDALVERLLTDLCDCVQVEQIPKMEGKQIVFIVVPKRK